MWYSDPHCKRGKQPCFFLHFDDGKYLKYYLVFHEVGENPDHLNSAFFSINFLVSLCEILHDGLVRVGHQLAAASERRISHNDQTAGFGLLQELQVRLQKKE